MAKKRAPKWIRKPEWERDECGCVKTRIRTGRVLIRCTRHRDKPTNSGRILCYLDDSGIVRRT